MGCFLLSSCAKDDEPQPQNTPGEQAKDCRCDNLLIGYFELEDCQIYLHIEPPFTCQGYDLLEIALNFGQHRITFCSTEYRFCKAPVDI